MNILLVNNIKQNQDGSLAVGGVQYHRMVKPNTVLKALNPEFDFFMTHGVLEKEFDELLKQSDLVIFNRTIGPLHKIPLIVAKLKDLGIPFGLDIDDYWHLPDHHIASLDYRRHKYPESTELSIKESAFVICTTEILVDKIRPLNKNVYVIENGIDTTDEVWQNNKAESRRLRFGFTQGNTHFEDLYLIASDVVKSFKDKMFYGFAQVVLTGFHGSNINKTIEQRYQDILTDKLKVIRRDYPTYFNDLRLNKQTEIIDTPFVRIWGMDTLSFAKVYDHIDVSVIPLADNEFNSCKSELKLIEAGFKGCAAMVSNVHPYSNLITKDNCFDLNEKNFFQWQRYIFLNPNCLEDKTKQLAEDVKKYDLKTLTPKRKELYLKYK